MRIREFLIELRSLLGEVRRSAAASIEAMDRTTSRMDRLERERPSRDAATRSMARKEFADVDPAAFDALVLGRSPQKKRAGFWPAR